MDKATLDLYKSERDSIIEWAQTTIITDSDESDKARFCVPVVKLFKLVRISHNIHEALDHFYRIFQEDMNEHVLIQPMKRSQPNRPAHKRMFTTLEGAMSFCYYIYSRRLYDYKRAYYCYGYMREIQSQMLDTVNCVRHVVVLNGLAEPCERLSLDAQSVMRVVLEMKNAKNSDDPIIDPALVLAEMKRVHLNANVQSNSLLLK